MQRTNGNADMDLDSRGARASDDAPLVEIQRLARHPEPTQAPNALLIDSQPARRARIRRRLEREGFAISEVEDGLAGWNAVRRRRPDLIVCCLQSRGLDGIELLKRVRTSFDLPVLLHTAVPDVAAAVEATRLGARDVLLVPPDLEKLIESARELLTPGTMRGLEARIIGKNSRMQCVRERVSALADLRVPVLICGEAGTGRDHIVRTLHAMSADRDEELTVIRDSESLTACAQQQRAPIYLDDLHTFTRKAQSYWLDKLKASRRGKGIPRIYASTAENLQEISRGGYFDAELATQISRFTIDLPPLRERIDDLAELSRALVAKVGAEMNRSAVRLTAPAIAALRGCAWTGNLSELHAVMEKLVAFSPNGRITRGDVRSVLKENSATVAALRRQNQEEQREQLVALLQQTGGNLAETARRMNMSRGAVIYRAKKFGLLAECSRRR